MQVDVHPLWSEENMSLLAHITMHEVYFVMAVFLFGLVSGFSLSWMRQTAAEREKSRR
jgi:hypothetical protein